ncbi:MAG: class I SAM-dependent methyltransferase [Burkholderiales bacterium]|nr:class I SAM-dependent methyltransferase [Burkholderiales bacterium]
MSLSNTSRRAVLALALSLFAAGAFAQAQPAAKSEFVPEVGQSGKDVVWVPTAQGLVDRMLDMAKLTAKDIHYDLGSGDGRTVITAARRGATAYGVEYNPDMVELSRRNAAKEKLAGKATFIHGDIFETDFSSATVITLFLLPELNVKLRPKILDMKPGTRVVSNSFTMGDWKSDETQSAKDNCSSYCTAYLWIVPAKVAGIWKSGNEEFKFAQEYQMVHGSVGSGGKLAPVLNGRMRGEDISFTAGPGRYAGKVNGDRIEGTVTAGGKTSPWVATRSGK